MSIRTVEEALSGFRELLFHEIKEELLHTEGHKVEVELSLPCSIDEDRYHHNIIKSIFLDKHSGRVMVDYTDDWNEEAYQDGIDMFSVDEILEIINAM